MLSLAIAQIAVGFAIGLLGFSLTVRRLPSLSAEQERKQRAEVGRTLAVLGILFVSMGAIGLAGVMDWVGRTATFAVQIAIALVAVFIGVQFAVKRMHSN